MPMEAAVLAATCPRPRRPAPAPKQAKPRLLQLPIASSASTISCQMAGWLRRVLRCAQCGVRRPRSPRKSSVNQPNHGNGTPTGDDPWWQPTGARESPCGTARGASRGAPPPCGPAAVCVEEGEYRRIDSKHWRRASRRHRGTDRAALKHWADCRSGAGAAQDSYMASTSVGRIAIPAACCRTN
ncbi:uncharacterized protein BDZ99DRAFT_470090 [Mytilinidion resinicola]|uniref:Uncharacterized protein n=1 Tax=Mytilinidion resinicola TaxID=574789 RepID=A0A6A6Z8G4_9PEZI|nr:uncharacterized protein BDZ99DRAFT_470090 [Mytilinidion resinicola]KAF2817023.1 hypothetical protein BDZ99DRAFT_470090 [Mytilinidion resinicola]